MRRLLTFALIGVVAQLVDGALGMAYGVTSSSLFLSAGTAAAVASASVHLAEVGTTFVSGVSHWRFGNVSWRTVRWIGIPGALGAFVGATVLSNVDGAAIKPWVSSLLLSLGLYVLARFAFGVNRKPMREDHLRGRFLAPLGVVGGLVDAIGGGGWGPVTTPALLTAGRMEPRRAVGSASASEFLVSVAASVGFLANLGHSAVDRRVVAGLLIGGVLIAPFAAWVSRRLHAAVMGTMVGVLIVVTNARTLMLARGVAGPTRLAVLLALVVAGFGLIAAAARRARVDVAAEELETEPGEFETEPGEFETEPPGSVVHA